MKYQILFIALLSGLLFSCQKGQENTGNEGAEDVKQASMASSSEKKTNEVEVQVVPFDAVAEKMADPTVGLRVINFWATWCKPCVKELPYFEKARAKYADKGVNFTLVSLDFAEEVDDKVIPFVEAEGIKSEVWLLDDMDYDSWIDKVDPDWSGEIPMTVIVDPAEDIKEGFPRELTYQELDSIIEANLAKYD